jgi:hypothetical protein
LLLRYQVKTCLIEKAIHQYLADIVFKLKRDSGKCCVFGKSDRADLFFVRLTTAVVEDGNLIRLLLVVALVRVAVHKVGVGLGPDSATGEAVVLVGARDEGLDVPDLEDVGLRLEFLELVEEAVGTERDNFLELEVLVDGFIDVERAVVL